MPDPAVPSKPPRRFWLWAPYAAVALVALWGAAGWFVLETRLKQGLDEAARRLRRQGYELSWQDVRVTGFPFRLDLALDQLRLAEPSGWAIAAPRLEGEAMAYDPGHWVLAFPRGLTLTRPGRGPMDVSGRAIRASIAGPASARRYAFQGLKLAFKAEPGAVPPSLASADSLELHLLPGPDDQAALLIRLDGGRANLPPGPSRLVGGRPISAIWDCRLTRFSQLSGSDWASAVRRWTGAGGRIDVRRASLTLGPATVSSAPASLTVGADGRLSGTLPLTLRQGAAALGALGAAQALGPDAARTAAEAAQARQGSDGASAMALTFQAGAATLGPVSLGPALRVY